MNNYVAITKQWKDKPAVLPSLSSVKMVKLISQIPDVYPVKMVETTKEKAKELVANGDAHVCMSSEAYTQFISHLYKIYKEIFLEIEKERKNLEKN